MGKAGQIPATVAFLHDWLGFGIATTGSERRWLGLRLFMGIARLKAKGRH
jgi:hypothetical protein